MGRVLRRHGPAYPHLPPPRDRRPGYELVDLELFLMWRARGMVMDTPAVRP